MEADVTQSKFAVGFGPKATFGALDTLWRGATKPIIRACFGKKETPVLAIIPVTHTKLARLPDGK